MNEESTNNKITNIPTELYEIRIQGILDPIWLEWFECQQITHTEHETILSCALQDQAALHGLLAKIRDLNLKLISVNRVEFLSDEIEDESHEDKN